MGKLPNQPRPTGFHTDWVAPEHMLPKQQPIRGDSEVFVATQEIVTQQF